MRRSTISVLIIGSLALGGCSVEKARALQGAALQFRNESLSAIEAIDTMRKRELEAPPKSSAETRQAFINRILTSRAEVSGEIIDLAIDPFQPPKVAEWDTFISDLRNQYEGFSEIFEKLDSKSVVSRDEVKKSAEYAQTLTVQMALLAKAISDNPPVLVQYRTSTIVKLQAIKREYQSIQTRIKAGETQSALIQRKAELESQTGTMLDEWQRIKQEEQRLLETTVAQCMKAAAVGKDVIETANRYDQLDLNQLNALVPRVLTTASTFTGRDYSSLRTKATRIVSDIQTDPLWRNVAQKFLDRVNTAAQSRVPNRTAEVGSLDRR
ncbi:hypothetical protein IQ250_00430 [Pseudanabaenaceae cyanobacterium LEGE 13415]|nr:hypothetical protein [Pseudanabaenaceae cyanobacterium LEGE 13415]